MIKVWYEEMLELNGANVEATTIYIAKILVQLNVTVGHYKEIYDRHPEIFAGWPSLHVLKYHYPQIMEKILEYSRSG